MFKTYLPLILTRTCFLIFCLFAGTAGPATALEKANGEIVLTVSGLVETTNTNGAAVFDMELLLSMEADSFETTTLWTDGLHKFTGIPLNVLLKAVNATGGTLRASAINDYTIEIPVTDAVDGGPIIAYWFDDQEMSVRDKGPLWIVYPYDTNPAFQTEEVYARSIWQLSHIEVVK